MRRHRGVDLTFQHLLHPRCDRVPPTLVRVVDPQGAADRRRVQVDDGAIQVWRAAAVHQDRQVGRSQHEVSWWRVFQSDQIQLVDELRTATASYGNP